MTVEKLLITQFVNFLNDSKESMTLDLPDYVRIGTPFMTSGIGLWVQVLGNAEPNQKYLRGKFQGSLPFALYYRLSAAELNGIEAKMIIPSENLEDFSSENTPVFDNFRVRKGTQTKGASPFSKGEDGTVIYQSLWRIDFEVI